MKRLKNNYCNSKDMSPSLTYDIISKLVLGNVVKQRREHRKQGSGGVVDILGYTFHLWEHTDTENKDISVEGQCGKTGAHGDVTDLVSTGHFAEFQILNHLLNVICSTLEELTQTCFNNLRA